MKNHESVFVVGLVGGIAFALGWAVKPEAKIAEVKVPEVVKPVELPPQKPDVSPVVAALFDKYHEEAVLVFDGLPGFGFDRILPSVRHDFDRITSAAQDVPSTSIFTDHDFTFIGSDDAIRRVKEDVVGENPAVFGLLKGSRSRAVPASGVDLLALETFEEDQSARRDFHLDGESVLGYGPLRATASCAKCHGVEEGTLLGMFRYRFEKPLDVKGQSLAVVTE